MIFFVCKARHFKLFTLGLFAGMIANVLEAEVIRRENFVFFFLSKARHFKLLLPGKFALSNLSVNNTSSSCFDITSAIQTLNRKKSLQIEVFRSGLC